jgi:curved DNA-binding protein
MTINYYKVLDVSSDATPDEIKAAYRKLARQYHPDLNPNDVNAKKKFQAINEANEILSNPRKRKVYDESVSGGKNIPKAKKSGTGKSNKKSKILYEDYVIYIRNPDIRGHIYIKVCIHDK